MKKSTKAGPVHISAPRKKARPAMRRPRSASSSANAEMDPFLQYFENLSTNGSNSEFLTFRQVIQGSDAIADNGEMKVEVLVELEDPDPLQGSSSSTEKPALPPGLELPAYGSSPAARRIYSGTAVAKNLAAIRKKVRRLKLATRVYRALDQSVRALGASREQLADVAAARSHATEMNNAGAGRQSGFVELDGAGVLVGVVDDGCDFQHPSFLAVGKTRLRMLWDQGANPVSPPSATQALRGAGTNSRISTLKPRSPKDFGYGSEWSQTEIDAALDVARTHGAQVGFRELQYEIAEGAHGTHVMDIVGGSGSSLTPNIRGVAPGADLAFVQLPRIQLDRPELLANGRHVLDAVDYLFRLADQKGQQCVVNLSLAANGGPHDGSTLIERGIEELVNSKRGRAVVVAAGNAYGERTHAHCSIMPGASQSLRLRVNSGDPTLNRVELWYPAITDLAVSIRSPSGDHQLTGIRPGLRQQLATAGKPFLEILHRRFDPGNNSNQVLILISPTGPGPQRDVFAITPEPGVWTIELANPPDGLPVTVHGWIERDDGAPEFGAQQSRFEHDDGTKSDEAFSLGSFSCSDSVIVVGAYNSATDQLLDFTASGPTRDLRFKPDLCAPGASRDSLASSRTGIMAASSINRDPIRLAGTSMAAAHVSGVIALMFQVARQPLETRQIRQILIESCQPLSGDPIGWNPRAGYGRIDFLKVLETMRRKDLLR
ncbi:MAG: S8 family serine peptidase [Blastocatellia bacterium]